MIRSTLKTAAFGLISTWLLVTLPILLAHGQVPHSISYQGKLVEDASGDPLVGPVEMTFRIFDADTNGHLLWEETHAAVVLEDGVYHVTLGGGNTTVGTFDADLFSQIPTGGWRLPWSSGTAHPETLSPRQAVDQRCLCLQGVGRRHLGWDGILGFFNRERKRRWRSVRPA